MAVTLGILALFEAKPGKGDDLADFLRSGREIAAAEEGTVTWHAFKLGDTTTGSSTRSNPRRRQAHLNGEIRKRSVRSAGAARRRSRHPHGGDPRGEVGQSPTVGWTEDRSRRRLAGARDRVLTDRCLSTRPGLHSEDSVARSGTRAPRRRGSRETSSPTAVRARCVPNGVVDLLQESIGSEWPAIGLQKLDDLGRHRESGRRTSTQKGDAVGSQRGLPEPGTVGRADSACAATSATSCLDSLVTMGRAGIEPATFGLKVRCSTN